MVGWLTTYWPAVLVGLIWGSLFSLVREFWRRLINSAVLFLLTYKVIINASWDLRIPWDHPFAASAILGVFGGCLVRPACARLFRHQVKPGKN